MSASRRAAPAGKRGTPKRSTPAPKRGAAAAKRKKKPAGGARKTPKGIKSSSREEDTPRGAGWLPTVMIAVAGILSVVVIRVANAPVISLSELISPMIYILCVSAVGLLLWLAKPECDRSMAVAAYALCGIGTVVQFRMGVGGAVPGMAQLALPLGTVGLLLCLFLFGRGRCGGLRSAAGLAWLASVGVISVVLVLGRSFRGAIFLPGGINPTEVIKFLLVIWMAAFMAPEVAARGRAKKKPHRVPLLRLACMWSLPMALLVLQRDLGLVGIMCVVLVVMLYTATGRVRFLLLGAVGGAVLVALVVALPHIQARLVGWQDPFCDATGRGWQILHSLSALYSGGLWGCGVGAGMPQAVPIVESDFVYAALGEEIGFIGCGAVLLLYLYIVRRGYCAAVKCVDPFCKLLGVGLATVLGVQVLVNVGGVTKALPVTGVTLPFISLGGSSLVVSLLLVGLLLALSDSSDT